MRGGDIPPGATHRCAAYDVEIYYKKCIDFIGVESGEAYYTWFFWDRNSWKKDTAVRSCNFKELKDENDPTR